MHSDYSGQGVDQLKNVIDTIKNNPNDRRIILCAWNPKGMNSGSYIVLNIPMMNGTTCNSQHVQLYFILMGYLN